MAAGRESRANGQESHHRNPQLYDRNSPGPWLRTDLSHVAGAIIMKPAIPHITVCICTYQRPGLLGKLLRELTAQETRDRFTYSVVVSDNDRQESAREAVQSFQKESALEVKYCVEPEQNIALARNRALANARGEFV